MTLPGLLAPRESRALVEDFTGGPVDKNPSANTRDTGSISGLGRPHMPWSNSPHTTAVEAWAP